MKALPKLRQIGRAGGILMVRRSAQRMITSIF